MIFETGKIHLISILIFILTVNAYSQLPPIKLDYASYAVTHDGHVIGYFGEKNRVEVRSTKNISKWVLYSLVATEDRDFYNHDGVSYKGLGRAILKTLTGSTQGGSTLTMQLARNLFLSREQTISRKWTEINLAKELEQKFSKDQLLLLYLNTVYFGHRAYGIWAAAQEYYNKTPDKLSITESAALVGLLQSPSGYDPDKNPSKMLARRNEVLYNLVEVGKLSEGEFKKLKQSQLNLNLNPRIGKHFLEHVRKEAVALLNHKGIYLNRDQIVITTTLDLQMQEAAEDAVNSQWNGLPESMKQAQIGLVAVEPGTGRIRSMIGGNPESEARGLNRAVQIYRQPGSAFKPFLYGELIEEGYTIGTPLEDLPISVKDPYTGQVWSPENSTNTFSNQLMPMIIAIQHSVNAAAAYAIIQLTKPDSVVNFAHRLGINSELLPYNSLSLGTSDVSPLEMAAAMAVFPSEGTYARPYSIIKIEDKHRNVLYRSEPETHNVLDSATAFLVTKTLETVVDSGTASSIRRIYKGTAAGKTGTTQNSTDAWFVGYNPELATAIWIGYDNPKRKLGGGFQYGGSACAPIWARMMEKIARHKPGFYYSKFHQPDTIVEIPICEETGLPATEFCPSAKIYPVDFLRIKNSCTRHIEQTGFEIW